MNENDFEVGVAIDTDESRYVLRGEPVLDSRVGILTVFLEDGTQRVFNFDHVISYVGLTQADWDRIIGGGE